MFGDKASRKRTGEGPGCHPFASLRASSERSEGSLRPASQTLRGVYPERSEWAQGDRPYLQMSVVGRNALTYRLVFSTLIAGKLIGDHYENTINRYRTRSRAPAGCQDTLLFPGQKVCLGSQLDAYAHQREFAS